MHLIKAGIAYCLLTFGVGLILGPLRVYLVEPHLGSFLATLLEAPLILVAMTLVCLWCLKHFEVSGDFVSPAVMGLVALCLLMIFEFAGALLLRGETIGTHAQSLLRPQGLLSMALFLIFAALPLLLRLISARLRS